MRERSGFTLVELSIVIVIIGLIVAGVLAGQSLVYQSNLRSITADITMYNTAVNTFRLQYNYLPGDLPNASSYWPSCSAPPPENCNGNGNNQILYANGPNNNEGLRAWQHLALAGMIPGTYTGIGVGTGNEATIGVNIPKSKFMTGGFSIGYSTWPTGRGAHQISLGTARTNGFGNPILTSREAYLFDSKTDDGKPLCGKIAAAHPDWGWGFCRACCDGSCDVYHLVDNSRMCTMLFTLQN